MIHPQLDKLHLKTVNRAINFQVGDLVKVHYKIVEGNKERVQVYEGLVIAINNRAAGKTFTVRRISYDVGVERIFPLYAPTIEKIELARSNRVRRGKLYYLRHKIGKDGRLKEIRKKTIEDRIFAKANELKAQEKANAPKVETESTPEEGVEETKE